MSYAVETQIGDSWENVWRENAGIDNPDGTPVVFEHVDDAVQAIKDHIKDCVEAVEGGDMMDIPDPADFRVTGRGEVHSYRGGMNYSTWAEAEGGSL